MKSLVLLNGSPRGERSSSMKMLARMAEGWERGGGKTPEVLHLARRNGFDRAVAAFAEADVVLVGMPLYTDAMPALVKSYIEALAPRVKVAHSGGKNLGPPCTSLSAWGGNPESPRTGPRAWGKNPTLGFLVQSGFPEALHSRPLERYLEKLARRLGSPYAGAIVRGGGESLQQMPDKMNKKLWARLRTLGEQLERDGRFGEAELKAVASTERFSPLTAALLSVACKLPITQFYWNMQLKKNGAWKHRFAAPYGPACSRS